MLDMAIGELLGFSYDAEAVGTTILNGLIAGPDLNATQPDDWDEEEVKRRLNKSCATPAFC